MKTHFLMSAAVAVLLVAGNAQAETISNAGLGGKLDEAKALAISQAAIGKEVRDQSFRDTAGRRVKLSDFRGKPLVISMIYSSCADVCPVITSTLERVDATTRDALGEDAYAIVTIGFDVTEDNPVRMLSFARKLGVPVSDHWLFLSGELNSVLALSEDLGFQFFESPKGFDHLTQTTILDADGKVYRHIYGETFETPAFAEPLKSLVFGTPTPFASLDDLLNKVRLFCTTYDPATDKYRFEYAIFFRLMVGAVVIGGMAAFVVKWSWRNWRVGHKAKKNMMKGAQC